MAKFKDMAEFFDTDKIEAEEIAERQKRFETAKKLIESCATDRFYQSNTPSFAWGDVLDALKVASGLSNLDEQIPSSIQ